jgi:hypothetical protein
LLTTQKRPPSKELRTTKHSSRESDYLQNQGAKGELDLEQTSFGGDPAQLIFMISSHHNYMQQLKKRSKDACLLVMHLSRKIQVPLIGTTQKLQIIHNICILHMSQTK